MLQAENVSFTHEFFKFADEYISIIPSFYSDSYVSSKSNVSLWTTKELDISAQQPD